MLQWGPSAVRDAPLNEVAALLGIHPLRDEQRDFLKLAAETFNRRTVRKRQDLPVADLRLMMGGVDKSATRLAELLTNEGVIELLATAGLSAGLNPFVLGEQLRALSLTARHATGLIRNKQGRGAPYTRANACADEVLCARVILEAFHRFGKGRERVASRARLPAHNIDHQKAADTLWKAAGNKPRTDSEEALDGWRRSFEEARSLSTFWVNFFQATAVAAGVTETKS